MAKKWTLTDVSEESANSAEFCGRIQDGWRYANFRLQVLLWPRNTVMERRN